MLWCWGSGAVAVHVDWVCVDGVHITVATVEAVTTSECKVHRDETIVAGKMDAPRCVGVFTAFLGQLGEDVAQREDGGR